MCVGEQHIVLLDEWCDDLRAAVAEAAARDVPPEQPRARGERSAYAATGGGGPGGDDRLRQRLTQYLERQLTGACPADSRRAAAAGTATADGAGLTCVRHSNHAVPADGERKARL